VNKRFKQSYYQCFLLAICLIVFAGSNAFAEPIQAVPVQAMPLQSIPITPELQQKIQQKMAPTQIQSVTPPESQKEHKEKKNDNATAIKSAPSNKSLSSIEQYISGKISPNVSTNIRQFGYDLFAKPSSTFAPSGKVPVGPNYVIGPGDEIRVIVWGKVTGKWNVIVNRDGNIALPKVGIIGVTGLTFKEIKSLLYRELSQYYSGFEMDVSMGRLRSIQVYVVGNARRPGAYTISSLSTLVNALFAAGGPAKTGTMRDIQVKRNGKTIVHFDVYDFLLKGDKTKDIRLMPEDVIFIPHIKSIVGMAGNVKKPAIYELSGSTKITDLIEMAGGVTASGFLQRIQLERVYENEVKIVIDTNLKEIDEKTNLVLHDGDTIKVFPISQVVVNSIVLKGNVLRPGQYQWRKGIRVSDIIKDTEKDILPETFFDHALIERYMPPDYHKEIISFNLGKALFKKDPREDKVLEPYDTLIIYSIWDFRERPRVRISGAVNKPGEFELKTNMTLSDLVNLAGGLKRYAFLEQAELTRVHITDQGPKTEKIKINLDKALVDKSKSNLKLEQDDYLFVRAVPEWRLYRVVKIDGEVKFPGAYTIEKDEPLSSLIKRAGGFTEDAYLEGSVFIRESIRKQQQKTINEMVDRLERELMGERAAKASTALTPDDAKIQTLETEQKRKFVESLRAVKAKGRLVIKLLPLAKLKGTPSDIQLEEGDSIHIAKDPMIVNVAGSVFNQNAFVYDRGNSISDYIKMAGGYTDNADKKKVYILKADGSAVKPGKGLLGIRWNSSKHKWNTGNSNLESGDIIIVPEKLERVAWLKQVKDITQILFQLAVSAAVVITF